MRPSSRAPFGAWVAVVLVSVSCGSPSGPSGQPVTQQVVGVAGGQVTANGGRIKLTKKDSGEGQHKGHHHFIDGGLVAEVEGNKVRLSANADVAVTFEEEK